VLRKRARARARALGEGPQGKHATQEGAGTSTARGPQGGDALRRWARARALGGAHRAGGVGQGDHRAMDAAHDSCSECEWRSSNDGVNNPRRKLT
jgi:hypothetical protein